MKERPIIFSGDNVRAIIDGRKTETRRIIKGKGGKLPQLVSIRAKPPMMHFDDRPGEPLRNPFGSFGDELWVRETWQLVMPHTDRDYTTCQTYVDDVTIWPDKVPSTCPDGWEPIWMGCWDDPDTHRDDRFVERYRPPIFMPRWASRLTLSVQSVGVERLHDITDDGARREGFDNVDEFRTAWEAMHTKPGTRWEDNPWVWVVRFEKVEDA